MPRFNLLPKWASPSWWPWRWEHNKEFRWWTHRVFFGRDEIILWDDWLEGLPRGWVWLVYTPHLCYLLTFLPSLGAYSRRKC